MKINYLAISVVLDVIVLIMLGLIYQATQQGIKLNQAAIANNTSTIQTNTANINDLQKRRSTSSVMPDLIFPF